MKHSFPRIFPLLVLAGLMVLTIGYAEASDISHLSGSYKVVHKTDLASETRIRLQLRLANHGQRDLLVKRISLWGSHSHPVKSATAASSIVVHTGASASTTQEFTIPRADYSRWSHGKQVRLLVDVEIPGGRSAIELVRLDQISSGKAN